jgi:hypothetical protein
MGKNADRSYTTSERLTLLVFAVSVALYLLNILLGKASIHWGWDVFYLGSVSEFLLLLFASITFVAAALHRERESNKEQNNK